ncbi:hypothetical protein [Streptomyces mirabilis]|uniref:hypothetical protein n=1 Tax=Streptomyces mirabilis TaxID=68239 RepID=UPI0036825BAC
MTQDLNTLLTALYVKIDDEIRPLITVGKQRLESLVRGDGLLEAVRRGPQDQQVDLLDVEFAEEAAPRERRWLRPRWSTLFASAADAQGDDGDKEPQGTEG